MHAPHKSIAIWMLGLAFSVLNLSPIDASDTGLTPTPRFSPLTDNREDLPSSRISTLTQDKQGIIWIATSNGLVRYDGTRFETILPSETSQTEFRSNYIESLMVAQNNTLWVNSQDALYYLEEGERTLSHIPVANEKGDSLTRRSRSITETNTGKILVSYTQGIAVIDIETKLKEDFLFRSRSEIPFINSILEKGDNEFWLGTGQGLWTLNLENNTFTEFKHPSFDGNYSTRIRNLLIDDDGNLWLGTFEGLYGFDADNNSIAFETEGGQLQGSYTPNIRELHQDSRGTLWVISANAGIFAKAKGQSVFKNYKTNSGFETGPPSNRIRGFTETQSGKLLFGTEQNGVWTHNPGQHTVLSEKFNPSSEYSLPFDRIEGLIFDETRNCIWFSSPLKGLSRYDLSTRHSKSVLNLQDKENPFYQFRLSSVAIRANGNLVLAFNNHQLIDWNPETKAHRKLHDENTLNSKRKKTFQGLIHIDSFDRIWALGTSLLLLDLKTEIQKSLDAVNEHALILDSVAVDKKGNAWLAAKRRGFGYYNTRTHKVDKWYQSSLLLQYLDSRDDTILLLDGGTLWIGCSNGLCSFDIETETFETYEQYPSLSVAITGLQKQGSDSLWVSTRHEISQFKITSGEIQTYDEKDGIDISIFNYNTLKKIGKEKIVIGSNNGLNIFQPNREIYAKVDPQPRITRIEVNGRSAPIDLNPISANHFDLSHEEDHFRFEFAAQHPLDTEYLLFEYRLKGHNDDWTSAPAERRIDFHSLPAGDYRFEVRANKDSDDITARQAALTLSISPPLHATVAFRAGASLFGIALISFLIYRRAKQLKHLNQQLQTQVQNRTIDLERSRQDALEAQKRAEQANNAKSEFLASISHEIRTPMNGIIGMNQLILESNPNEEIHGYSNTINHSAETLLVLINDLLDFSKIEANKLQIENAPFDLRQICEDLSDLLSVKAYSDNLDFNFEIPAEVPTSLIGDEHRIKQVLTNLIGNAIKFTESGSVNTRIKLQRETESSVELAIEVEDTGVGIPEDVQHKLFQSFTQADASTTRKFGGTGLGLSISKSLVDLMDGEISLRSEEGIGSHFTISLTLEKAPETHPAPFLEENAPIAGKRILVIDSSDRTLEGIIEWLDFWNARGFRCNTLEQAARYLSEASVANAPFNFLIISDRVVTPKNAQAFGSLINAHSETKIVLLHRPFHSEAHELLEHFKAQSHATLPFKPAQFLTAVMQAQTSSHSVINGQAAADATSPAISNPDTDSAISILLVDDNKTNRLVGKAMLKKRGITPDEAEDGLVAIERSQFKKYSLILMDCMMPELDGYKACMRIREDDTNPNQKTAIIALTANAMEGDREKCLAAGMDDYLEKPLRPAKLNEILDHWIHKEDADSQETSASPMKDESSDVVNFETLYETFDNDHRLVRELFEVFKNDLAETIPQIQKVIDQGDFETASRQAHTLKGSAANYGALRLKDYASDAEQACNKRDMKAAIGFIEGAVRESKRVIDAIEAHQWPASQN